MALSQQQDSALDTLAAKLKDMTIEPRLALRLAAFCTTEGEEPSAVVHDALTFYLDEHVFGAADFSTAPWPAPVGDQPPKPSQPSEPAPGAA